MDCRKIDKETYIDRLVNAIWLTDDLPALLGMNAEGAHTYQTHCPELISEKEMIDRIVAKNRSYGIFESKADADDLIKNLITSKVREIADWLYTKRSDYDGLQDYQRKCLSMDMKITVGHGFTRDFKEVRTPVLSVILQRNRDAKRAAPYGFYLVTAYPDLNSDKAVPTGREFSRQEIAAGGMYDFRTSLEKAAFLCENQGRIKVQYLDAPEPDPYVRLSCKNEDTWYYAFISEQQQSFMKRADTPSALKTYIPYTELKEICPDLAEMTQRVIMIAETKARTPDERIADAQIRAKKISADRTRFERKNRHFREKFCGMARN